LVKITCLVAASDERDGEAVWEEGVEVEEEEAAVLEAAEQVGASQQLIDEQLGQLVHKQDHAPRLLVPKQHHQLVQAQA